MNIKNMIFSFRKSFLHFVHLLKNRKYEKIYQISRYYFMDQVIRRIFIAATIADGRLRPPKHLHTCPSCEKSFPYFYPITSGSHFIFHSQCPYCKSYERHRAQWLYYNRETDIFHPKHPIAILHCSPEQLFYKQLKNINFIDYYPIDKWTGYTICGERMRDYADITKLPYEDNKFDYILCNHVLEHIPDEQLALSELKRVLKPEGVAFLNVPIDQTLTETLENPAYNTDALRLKYYGQCDHVRKYGLDYEKHLEKAGFHVTSIIVRNYFSKKAIYEYGLTPDELIYSYRKN